MKKILVPISFSEASKHAMLQAYSIVKQYGTELSLLHCYPAQEYNRRFDFGKEAYGTGIKRMVINFFNENIENGEDHDYSILTYAGIFSDVIAEISEQYDLLVFCRKTGFQEKPSRHLNDKLFYVSSLALCPVLVTSQNQEEISLNKLSHIWHIERNKMEKDLVNGELNKLGISTEHLVAKSLSQEHFVSAFWKKIVSYSKTHDKILLKDLGHTFQDEKIDLFVMVNHLKGMFSIFIKNYAFQTIQQLDVPILIFPSKTK